MTGTTVSSCDASEQGSKKNPSSNNPKRREQSVIHPYKCVSRPLHSYRCKDCRSFTSLLINLKWHSATGGASCRRKAPMICYVCDFCNFETYSRLVLLNHMHTSPCTVSKMKPLMLTTAKNNKLGERCVKLYSPRELIVKNIYHVQRQATRPLRKCLFCSFSSREPGEMDKHMKCFHLTPEEIKWHTCVVCSFKSKLKSELEVHQVTKHTVMIKKMLFRCKNCKGRFRTKEQLDNHIAKRHENEADMQFYYCDKCPHKTQYKSHFDRHKKEQHTDGSNKLLCEHCGYRANQNIHMKLHMIQKHTADKDIEWYKCAHCDYKAKLKASLKDHILRKHATDTKWFECELCEYKTFKRYLLKTHVKNSHNKTKKKKK